MTTRWIAPGALCAALLLSGFAGMNEAQAAYDLEAVFLTSTGESPAQQDKSFTVRLKNNGPDRLPAGYKVSLNKFDNTGQGFIKQIGAFHEVPRLAAGQTQQFSFTETGPTVGGFFYKAFIGSAFSDTNNGNHRPEVWVAYVAPANVTSAPLTVALTAGPPSGWTCPGEVTLNATVAGGAPGETSYQFIVYRTVDGAQVGLRNFGSAASFAWTPPSAGRYRLRVIAKRGSTQVTTNVNDYDVKMPLTMSAEPAGRSNTAVKVTAGVATVSCAPSGTTLHFTFRVVPGGGQVTSTQPTWTSDPLAPGTYTIRGYAFAKKDGNIWAAYDRVQEIGNYIVVATAAAAPPSPPRVLPPVITRVTEILDFDRAKAAGSELMQAPEFITGCYSNVTRTADGTQFSLACPGPTGQALDWRAYQNFRLKNGWMVKSFSVLPGAAFNAGSELAEPPAVNTSNPAIRMHLWANGMTGSVITIVRVVIEGPQGTDPYR